MIYYLFLMITPILYVIIRPKVYGRRNLNVKGKAIFISNHTSMWDPVLLGLVSPRIIHFMAKAELFNSKIKNMLFRAMYAFPVNRKKVDMVSIKKAIEVLDKGKVFGIFPEGKRSITGELDKFEKGTAFLMLRSGAPIVPIYIQPYNKKRLRPKIMIGEPISINSLLEGKKGDKITVLTERMTELVNGLRTGLETMDCR